eukprot:1870215-Prymnesium_polylepis.1
MGSIQHAVGTRGPGRCRRQGPSFWSGRPGEGRVRSWVAVAAGVPRFVKTCCTRTRDEGAA